jgi:hypothetical protein
MRIRRGGTIAAAVVAGLVIGATVVRRHNNPGIPLLPGPARRQALAEAKLRVVLPEVKFRGTPLEKALQDLQARSGATFVVDWDAIEFSNLNRRDDPVDLSLTNVTVEQALKALLGYVNGGRSASVAYTLFEGAVVITTDDELGKYVYAAVYDLRDIETGPPIPFDPMVQMRNVAPHLQADERLGELIEGTVAPDSWYRGSPGKGVPVPVVTGGTVTAFGGRVVAVTTWNNHRQIQSLIAELRNPSH